MTGKCDNSAMDANIVRDLFDYDPVTGQLRWRHAGPKRIVGASAGTVTPRGYVQIGAGGKTYLAHRLAWLHVHGEWPANQLDHIDGDKTNNRIANLRQCVDAENAQNRARHRNNTSGSTGTYRDQSGMFCARIRSNRKLIHLGTFGTQEEATSAYLAAKASLHTFAPVPRQT